MSGLRAGPTQSKKKDLNSISSPFPARQSLTKQLPSPPHRRSTSRSKKTLLLSPALSSLSSPSASASPDRSGHPFSPSREINFLNPLPSPVSVSRDLMEMPSYSGSGDTSPTLTATTVKGKGKGKGKERQTRLQEHLISGKPGSSSSSSNSKATTKVIVAPAKRGRKPKVVAVAAEEVVIKKEILASSLPIGVNLVNSNLIEIAALSEEEAEVRLSQEKNELMRRLADYGLSPDPEILDNALLDIEALTASPEGPTVQSFLQSVISQSKTPRQFDNRKSRPSVTFDLHQSPPSASTSQSFNPEPRTPLRSSTRGATRLSNSSSAYPTSILSTPTSATLAPSPHIVPVTPSDRKHGRLSAFNSRRNSSTMVAAELQGMGRVAMSKEVLFERLGSDTAEKAMTAASDLPSPSLLFGQALPQLGSPIIDAFSSARRKSGRASMVRELGGEEQDEADEEELKNTSGDDKRIGLVKAWLDSPELVEDQNREGWSSVPQEWSDDVFTSKGPFVEDPVEVEEVEVVRRGGGKSVRGLVKTKRRRSQIPEVAVVVEGFTDVEIEDDDVSLLVVDEDLSVFKPSSSIKKGKGRPIISGVICICDSSEEGEAMVRCDDCAVWYHLECLDISSAKDLGKEWFCFKCSGSAVPVGPSPSKRAKMGVPPTTPVLKSEPIFVPSAFSPKPKGNFYRNSTADMVLAPSPQSSPIRRPAPFIAPPTTPQGFIHSSRTDYSPRSPLHHHHRKSRLISGSFEEQSQLWDHSNYLVEEELNHHHSLSAHHLHHSAFDEEVRIWHDVNMTPSRSLSSSAFGWTESSAIGTPLLGNRRSATLALGISASQDFLSGLNGLQLQQQHDQPIPPGHPLTLLEQRYHDHQTQQRVFSQPLFVVPSSPSSSSTSNLNTSSSHYALSSSPLGPKGGRPLAVVGASHQRRPSLPSNFFHPSSSTSSATTTKVVAQGVFSSPDRRANGLSKTLKEVGIIGLTGFGELED